MHRVNSNVPGNSFLSLSLFRVLFYLESMIFLNVFVLVTFVIPPEVSIYIAVFWHVMLCILLQKYRRFGDICCIYLQSIVKGRTLKMEAAGSSELLVHTLQQGVMFYKTLIFFFSFPPPFQFIVTNHPTARHSIQSAVCAPQSMVKRAIET
jgi:hypothetical protein